MGNINSAHQNVTKLYTEGWKEIAKKNKRGKETVIRRQANTYTGIDYGIYTVAAPHKRAHANAHTELKTVEKFPSVLLCGSARHNNAQSP